MTETTSLTGLNNKDIYNPTYFTYGGRVSLWGWLIQQLANIIKPGVCPSIISLLLVLVSSGQLATVVPGTTSGLTNIQANTGAIISSDSLSKSQNVLKSLSCLSGQHRFIIYSWTTHW